MTDQTQQCHCESSHCDHERGCSRPADPAFRVDYVMHVCTDCAETMIEAGGGEYVHTLTPDAWCTGCNGAHALTETTQELREKARRYEAIVQRHRMQAEGIDSYASRGVWLTRDAAHAVLAALGRDSYELRARGGQANLDAADVQDALRRAIGEALAD